MRDVPLSDEAFEALSNSTTKFEIVGSGAVVPSLESTSAAASGGSGAAAEPGEEETKEELTLPDGFLDRAVDKIIPDLDGKPVAFLAAVKAAEEAGKTRKSLIARLDELIAA
jgi:hypothetical protein